MAYLILLALIVLALSGWISLGLADINGISRARGLATLAIGVIAPLPIILGFAPHQIPSPAQGIAFLLIFFLSPVLLGYNQKKILPHMYIMWIGLVSWAVFFISSALLPH